MFKGDDAKATHPFSRDGMVFAVLFHLVPN